MKMTEELYLKFPSLLRQKIKNGQVKFPLDTLFQYTPVKAYRCIVREPDDMSAVTRNDFKSYAEEGKRITRNQVIDSSKPDYYGVSLFRRKEIVENKMKFPNPHKKMAEGFVFQEGGPQRSDKNTEHVCWWLYETIDLTGFKIV